MMESFNDCFKVCCIYKGDWLLSSSAASIEGRIAEIRGFMGREI